VKKLTHKVPSWSEKNTRLRTKLVRRMVEEGWAKTLPPDPENMNEIRAGWGNTAVRTFLRRAGEDDVEAMQQNLGDLLSDLMHWADRQQHVDFTAALESACYHYNAETEGRR
jgi:hypothetical protein